ncbi:MAG: uracil-DNA glycosylase [Pseudomonadota bacterium]
MNADPVARLRTLGLWPAWRSRDPRVFEPSLDDSPAPGPVEAVTASPRSTLSSPKPPVSVSPDVGPVAAMDWAALHEAVRTCTGCPLHATRTQGVLGVGDVHADWLIVGEAPGAEEDRQGEPFVGQAGKLLDAMLAAIGLTRGENVYIANILKSRPPGNRDPKPEEAAACRPYLDRQLTLIQPRILLALGRIAAQNLLATDAPITRLRGRVHDYHGVPLVVTYHPAYLLRNPADKAKAWDDLCLARKVMASDSKPR